MAEYSLETEQMLNELDRALKNDQAQRRAGFEATRNAARAMKEQELVQNLEQMQRQNMAPPAQPVMHPNAGALQQAQMQQAAQVAAAQTPASQAAPNWQQMQAGLYGSV